MPNMLDDFVCELSCEEYFDSLDYEDEEYDRDRVVQDTIDLDKWCNW